MNINNMLKDLTTITGAEYVTENPEIKNILPLSMAPAPRIRPGLKVSPGNVEEVRQIVCRANQTGTPLIPISSGEPHFRGDTSPLFPDSIIVDLSRMNKILKIDRRNRIALIQPGVTHAQLLPELKKKGLRLNMPLLPKPNKSVIASLLEREPVMSPKFQWSLLEPLRSLEIIWGNGDHFYTGAGFFRGENDSDLKAGVAPVQGAGAGPSQVDFYKFISAAQGSMGIVTWASVKCEILPRIRKLLFVTSRHLENLIDFTYRVVKYRFGDELFILNSTYLANILSASDVRPKTAALDLPPWSVVIDITGGDYFPEEQVSAQELDIADIAQSFGLSVTPQINGVMGHELLDRILAIEETPYWKLYPKGASEEIFFLTTLDKTAGFIKTMKNLADEHSYPASDIGIYLQPAHQGVCCHCEFILPFDQNNRADLQRTAALSQAAAPALFRQGAFFSRPYGAWAEMVYNADAGAADAIRKIKHIFDPNGVMNPGKLCF